MGVYVVTIHPTADVHHTVILGEGCVVHTGAVIQEGTSLGPYCVVGNGVSIGRRCEIGQGCVLHTGAAIGNESVLGDYVYVGPHVVLINTVRPALRDRSQEHPMSPLIEDDVVLGAHALIMPGVLVGRGAFVGAASVVYKSVAPGVTVLGNPARVLRLAALVATGAGGS
jgi:acetyltransferase-like isoleucine patch superfamily enzyme